MHPHLIDIFGIEITTYGLMVAAAFATLWINVVRRGKRLGYQEDFLQNLLTFIVVGAIVCARLLHVIIEWEYYSKNPSQILFTREAGVFLGGFIGAFLLVVWYTRKHNQSPLGVMDLLAAYLPLSHAIGRVGCFLFGCCYGSVCDLPWAVRFPQDSPAYVDLLRDHSLPIGATSSLPVHPTQLYSALANLIIFLLLLGIRKKQLFRGQIAMCYMIMYGIGRFFIEFVRGDYRGTWLGFSTSQWFSLAMIIIGIGLYLKFRDWAFPPEVPEEQPVSE